MISSVYKEGVFFFFPLEFFGRATAKPCRGKRGKKLDLEDQRIR